MVARTAGAERTAFGDSAFQGKGQIVALGDDRTDVLVFTRTAGYRHESIPAGAAAVGDLAAELGLTARHTEDPAALRPERLARCAAVVFLSTTGDVLDAAGRAALEAHVRGGGGFVAVHAAANAEPGWPFYGELLGARFAGHPEVQPADVGVEDAGHPATAGLGGPVWRWTDEWYDFAASPRGGAGVRVLLTVDEASYQGGMSGADHPIAWCQEVGAGRSFFTALGHEVRAYADPVFRAHLRGGLAWAVRAAG